MKQLYQQQLQFDQEVLKYDINKLNTHLSLLEMPKPCYDNVQRITNKTQLKLLCVSSDNHQNTLRYHLIGQIVKKRDLSSIIFIELLISASYLIKIAFEKETFTKQQYNEMRSKYKLGAIIECKGYIENYNAPKLVLIINEIKLIKLFKHKGNEYRGFEGYKETNQSKSKQILCSHFIKHFLTKNKDEKHIEINSQFIPKICIKSKCKFRHKLIKKLEMDNIMQQIHLRTKVLDEEYDANDPFCNSKQGKVARARFFADWVVGTYGLSNLRRNGVLDIAGGGGDLSNILSEYNIAVTVIDPRKPIKLNKKINKKIKKLRKKNVENNILLPSHIGAWFDWNILDKNTEIKTIFDKCEVVLGLHPDEATEPLVDLSLEYNKQFATLPCCVFPNLYPKYMMIGDRKQEVITYLDFVKYLQRKNRCINVDYLPFKGRNKVLYITNT